MSPLPRTARGSSAGVRIVRRGYGIFPLDSLQSRSRNPVYVNAAVFSSDSNRIATGSGDSTARIWDAATGQQLFVLKGHSNKVLSVAFSPDGKRVVSGSADKTAIVWDAMSGKAQVTLKGHTDAVMAVAFTADGNRTITRSSDKTAKIWVVITGREVMLNEK